MYLQLRHKLLLKNLLTEDNWVKSNQLSKNLNVTARTVRNDINQINSMFHSGEIVIESSRQNGYKLKYKNLSDIKQLIFDEYKIPNSPEERLRYISIKLLQVDESEPQVIDDLADDLVISIATLETNLRKIKEILESRTKPFKIHRKCNKVWTTGDEETRRFLLRELILDRSDSNYTLLDNYYSYFGKGVPELVMDCITNALNRLNLEMTDGDIIHIDGPLVYRTDEDQFRA